MAKTTGTADDYQDLLVRLRDWMLNTVGWTELRYTPGAGLLDTTELWLRGPGAGSGKEVVAGFRTETDTAIGAYVWGLRCATDFDNEAEFGGQLNTSPKTHFCLWENAIPYWFYANDRRLIVIAKINTSYISMYSGMFLPFGLPSEYPLPLYVAGNYGIVAEADRSNAGNRMIADPGANSAYYMERLSNTWRPMQNSQYASNSDLSLEYLDNVARIWPHRTHQAATNEPSSDWNVNGFGDTRPLLNGASPMWPCHIIDGPQRTLPGALDGVFAIPGFGRVSEQLINANGRTFRAFQSIYRTSGQHFMAIEEI